MKFGPPAICLAALVLATGIDLGIRREASVFGSLIGALIGTQPPPSPMEGPGVAASEKSSADSAARARARIVVTPLPTPSVTVGLRIVGTPGINTITLSQDGQVDLATLPVLKQLMRCRRTGREHAMAPGILAMLASIAKQWPERVIDVVSAFRSPPFGVPNSKHFIGHAIDLRVEGVKTAELRDFIWREHRQIGVGYYLKENFVHMDWRPGEPDSAWSAGREGDTADYNPRWAWTARHPSGRNMCEAGCS